MSKLRVMTLINASGCKVVHIAREKNIMADFLSIVFKEQVRRDFGPEAEQEIEFINHIERMNEDFKDWIDGFQFTGTVIQYGDDLVYYKNGNELTFQPTRYDNMKNWEKRSQQTEQLFIINGQPYCYQPHKKDNTPTNEEPNMIGRLMGIILGMDESNPGPAINPIFKISNYIWIRPTEDQIEREQLKRWRDSVIKSLKPNHKWKPVNADLPKEEFKFPNSKGFMIPKLINTATRTTNGLEIYQNIMRYDTKHYSETCME